MTTITEENEIIIGLAVRIRIGFREGMNKETCDHVVYMFQPIDRSHHHLVHQGFLIDFDAAKIIGHTYSNQYIQELFLQCKHCLHDDVIEKRFERGYITNKQLFVSRKPAFEIAHHANQLRSNVRAVSLDHKSSLYSVMLSPILSEYKRDYKKWFKQVTGFTDFNCVVLSPTKELKHILGLHYNEITDYTEDEKYKPLIAGLTK
jgi:hypothetical protein